MRDIMSGVFEQGGTAKTAKSKLYHLYGKTGTAHVAAGSHGEEGHGYGETDYDSSFLCGGPFSSPRLICVVTMHKPDPKKGGYFGGTVSAPAAVAIMERSLMYLQVPGDVPPPAPTNGRRVAMAGQ
jgi:cell division protein FtsI (penicillin-binding protein 3)